MLVSGFQVGSVTGVELDGPRVLIKFDVDKNIPLGDRTEAAIKAKSLLGAKVLEITPRGESQLAGPIPLERTTPAYELPDALGDLTQTVDSLDTDKLNESLRTLSQTFKDTPPQFKTAVEGVARFSQALNERDTQLRDLLANANTSTSVLAQRTDQIVNLIVNANALLVQLQSQSSALDEISGNISALSQQISGFVDDNRTTLRASLDKLNGVLTIVDNRKQRVQKSLQLLNKLRNVARRVSFGGPILQGLHRQPAARPVHSAFRRRSVLRSGSGSQRIAALPTHRPADWPAGNARTAGALSQNWPGWRTAPDTARRDHGQPG